MRVARHDRKQRRRREVAARRLKKRTRLLAALAGGSVLTLFGVELARVWKLGSLPAGRTDESRSDGRLRAPGRLLLILREGLGVTSTSENAAFIMLGSFVTTFGIARSVTYVIRSRGGIGPIHDVQVGDRHIHHFVPGVLISFLSGGIAIASRNEALGRWMAVPFGVGVALVLDETALLLELEDVYWAERGVVSIEVAFGAIALFALIAYLIRVLRRGELQARELDWVTAASAWDQLQGLPGSGRRGG
jgi:hypothetical protein